MNAPIIISTWSFGQRGNAAAWPELSRGGSALDAVERACIAVEEDEEVDSVGFGGLPDASGEVSLDASIMLSPVKCGSVTYVRRYLSVASIARRVMERTEHVMLSGEGAEHFAREQGFIERTLLSDGARKKWIEWKNDPARSKRDRSRDSGRGLRPVDAGGSGALFGLSGSRGEARWSHGHDTIGTLAIDASGVLAGACSTSGTPFKTPGRVGDSPIIGHGLYVLPGVGAATATGTGERIMGTCGSFLIVECMRRGAMPIEAVREALARVNESFAIRPADQVAYLALAPDGSFAAGALRGGFKAAVRDAARDVVIDPDFVLRDD
jgi:N4-(beta-N-acetylglucosaminyl)-L-asparaginase